MLSLFWSPLLGDVIVNARYLVNRHLLKSEPPVGVNSAEHSHLAFQVQQGGAGPNNTHHNLHDNNQYTVCVESN